jgi:hypothetical protein
MEQNAFDRRQVLFGFFEEHVVELLQIDRHISACVGAASAVN